MCLSQRWQIILSGLVQTSQVVLIVIVINGLIPGSGGTVETSNHVFLEWHWDFSLDLPYERVLYISEIIDSHCFLLLGWHAVQRIQLMLIFIL